MSSPTEYACVYARPPRERLVAAERLVRALPGYLDGSLAECDLFHATATRYLAVVIRAAAGGLAPVALARLAFWTARTGGGGFAVSDLSEAAREKFRGELNLCDRSVKGVPLPHVADAAARVLRAVKSPPPVEGPPVLAVDLDGRGREGLRYEAGPGLLFVASVLAPPVGDAITLSVRLRGTPVPLEARAIVSETIGREQATAGRAAGFRLRIDPSSPLAPVFAERLPEAPAEAHRVAPRFTVAAPVKIKPVDPPAPAAPPAPRPATTTASRPPTAPAAGPASAASAPPPAVPAPRARLEYATDQELAADWLENLSHGGAFVRTSAPRPVGTRLVLDLSLPDGVQLAASAVVVSSTARGMGVQFELDAAQSDVLAAVIARISARPRHALVVDDDALMRQMLADALAARGFEVTTAADAAEGVRRLSEELLALDLLVTDVCMPGMSGEELVRFIRRAGGEAELTIGWRGAPRRPSRRRGPTPSSTRPSGRSWWPPPPTPRWSRSAPAPPDVAGGAERHAPGVRTPAARRRRSR
jgi:CheY-like chemotaxis protein